MPFGTVNKADMRAGPAGDGIIFHDDGIGVFRVKAELSDGVAEDSDLRFPEQGCHVHWRRIIADNQVAL